MFLSAPTEAKYINEIVMGDTLDNGSRVAEDRVYVLERGGVWLFNGIITNSGWHLNMRASDGDGALPVIYGVVAEGGTEVADKLVEAEGDITLKNIAINGIFDLDTAYTNWTYGAPTELIEYNSAGDFSLNVQGCVLENAKEATLRTSAGIRSVIVRDCIFANSGTSPYASVSNGRCVDLREVSCDTLLMVNNTMVNGNDRVVRHIASTGRLNNFFFEHNTIVNNGGRYGVIAMGLIGDNVKIKDNLFVDPMVFGSDTTSKRQTDFQENGEAFSSEFPDKANLAMIYHQLEAESETYPTTFDISNNYWYYTPEILSVYETIRKETGDKTLKIPPRLTDYLATKAGETGGFIELDNGITFSEVPDPMADYAYWNLSDPPTGANESSSGGIYQDYDRRPMSYTLNILDASYPTSSVAYTGASQGFPAGDLNWFPQKKSEWENITDVEDISGSLPTEFVLSQNYPNPFNPTTTINFSIPESGLVSLSIYNVLGQEVARVVNEELSAGSYKYSFDASKLASGVYIYKLKTQNFVTAKKMMLLK